MVYYELIVSSLGLLKIILNLPLVWTISRMLSMFLNIIIIACSAQLWGIH